MEKPVVAAILMVKNEHHVVLDALRSLQPAADHWVVLDTGSTDGTQDLLREYAAEQPGFLHEAPFTDFASTRNVLLDLAEPTCDWMVILDADMAWDKAELLRQEIEEVHPQESVDGLAVQIGDSETYWQVRVFRTGRGWRYKYRTHELAVHPSGDPDLRFSATEALHFATGGSRSDKFERDLRLLAMDLEDNPDDPITHYYLAGTHRVLGDHKKSIREYRKAIALEKDPESEASYISHFHLAEQLELAGMPEPAVEDALLQACTLRPGRFEARAVLYRRLVETRRHEAVLELERLISSAPAHPSELMFVRPEARAETRLEVARALHAAGKGPEYAEARSAILADPDASEAVLETVKGWPAHIS